MVRTNRVEAGEEFIFKLGNRPVSRETEDRLTARARLIQDTNANSRPWNSPSGQWSLEKATEDES